MTYKNIYITPDNFSNMIMTSDGNYLTGLYFLEEAKKYDYQKEEEKSLPIFNQTKKWLDIYFEGKIPNFTPQYKINNLTPFRTRVIEIVSKIPYGKTITYGDIAKIIANEKGIKKVSSRAVGQAVGFNPICIIIPCHRVIGTKGNLTGYGGGMPNKIALLTHEKNDMSKYFYKKEVPNNPNI